MTLKNNDLMTVHEVAIVFRVDDTTVRRWIKTGSLEAVSLPHVGARESYRIRRETVDTFLQGSTASPPVETEPTKKARL